MKSYIIILLFLALFGNSVYSQSHLDSLGCSKFVTRLHILPPGLCMESQKFNNTTLIVDMGSILIFKENFGIGFAPYMAFEYRMYTNLLERYERGKRTDHYSGAYGSFRVQGVYNFVLEDESAFAGPLVGFQRALGKHAYWNIGVGVGAKTGYDDDISFGLIGNFELGFLLK